jgi:UDP-N-acetyl-2-amino-2-deoxyglucuronate dehydrogenase
VERIGTAVIGLGKVASAHAEALASLPGSRFLAVLDADPGRAGAFADRYGVRAHASLDSLLTDASVRMVSICTPHPTHAALAIRVAESGRHVLVEKPMALNLADCDAMIRAAAANGVLLGVVSQRRLYEPVRRMRDAIVHGRIGRPILATVTVLGWRGEDYYAADPWRGTWAGEGGGILVNQVTHHLDLLQWFMGPVEEVFGYCANLNHRSIEVEDTAIAVLRFQGGALGSIVVSNSQRPGLFGRIHVHGETGASVGVQTETGSAFIAGVTGDVAPSFNDIWTIAGDEDRLPGWQREDRDRASRIDVTTHYHRAQIEDFLDAIRAARPPLVTGEEGRKSVEIATAIYMSQGAGEPVRFPVGHPAVDNDGDDDVEVRASHARPPGEDRPMTREDAPRAVRID